MRAKAVKQNGAKTDNSSWTWGGNVPPELAAEPTQTIQDILAGQARSAEPCLAQLKELVEKAKAAKRGELSLDELRKYRKRDLGGLMPLLSAMACALRVKAMEYQLRGEAILGPQQKQKGQPS